MLIVWYSYLVSNKYYSPCSKKHFEPIDQKEVQSKMEAVKYEILYIIRPDLGEEGKKALVEQFDNILKDNGAEIIESSDWAKNRRLAYEIEGYREGDYWLVTFTTENSEAIDEFQRLALINDDILRHMVVRLDHLND